MDTFLLNICFFLDTTRKDKCREFIFEIIDITQFIVNSNLFLSQYKSLKAESLKSRHISNLDIEPLLSLLSNKFDVSVLGHSEPESRLSTPCDC